MLAKRIIPCLDVTNGRVVKGINFIDLKDAGDPVECAKAYEQQGADELVFLDITASSDNRNTMVNIVERCAQEVFMPLTVGGGIRTLDDVRIMLNAGADKVSFNTAAIKNPSILKECSESFGSQCTVLAIDAKLKTSGKWSVFSHGGRNLTALDVLEWSKKAVSLGIGEILLTSMDADGTKSGYDIKLTNLISSSVPVPVIASGGAGKLEHLSEALIQGNADAVLAASIFHFGEFTIGETKKFLIDQGIQVRI